MHPRYFLFALTCVILTSSTVWAQSYVDLFSAEQSFAPNNATEGLPDDRVSIFESNLNVRMPLASGESNYWLLNIASSRILLDYESGTNPPELWDVSVPIGYKWGEINGGPWDLVLLGLPKIASDMQDISGQDFQMGGVALLSRTMSETLKYKFGVYYSGEFFAPLFVPLFGAHWQPNDRWELFGNLPVNGTVLYKWTPRVYTGLHFVATIRSYRLEEALDNQYLHKTNNELFAYTDLYLTEKFVFRAMVGRSVGRSYRLFAENDQLDATLSLFKFGPERNQLNNDFEDGLVYRASLIYRYSL